MLRPPLAITIDDLPAMWMEELPRGPHPRDDRGAGAARQLLAAVRRHAIPLAVFVNSARIRPEDAGLLREWGDAGVELGNHTANHLCVDEVSEADWQADVLSCHEALSAVAFRPPRFFRFPYLKAGNSAERRRATGSFLTRLGYTVAPVTAVTSEWLLAHYYQLALEARADALREELSARLVPHVVASLEAAGRLAHACAGRTVPQIVLLHVNQLTADRIDNLIEVLGRQYELIAIDDALRDPAFATRDAGSRAGSWSPRTGTATEAEISTAREWVAIERRAILEQYQPILGWPSSPSTPMGDE